MFVIRTVTSLMVVLSKYWSQASRLYDGLSSHQTACIVAATSLGVTMALQKWRSVTNQTQNVNNKNDDGRQKRNKNNPAVNRQFFSQLKILLRVSLSLCLWSLGFSVMPELPRL